ncbi:hypothetical protein B0H67DRAFT_578364 [Lasiosphaeris hirsuta]|uniref:Uncharacterized protein n=1 Tax=Lasiosphaeris hirsuta TaxID=260670 RepID=A0AA40AEV9_9PEZI|nr:hypothetical protein B0H67DRAFT_578364 [Lasiosphaeris hirsuta]
MENHALVVPIGSDSDNLYRLVVRPYHLMSHDQNCGYMTLDGTEELIDGSILGVNMTIQPREPALPVSRCNANLSEQSTRSAESDDDHPRLHLLPAGDTTVYVAQPGGQLVLGHCRGGGG